MKPKITLYFYIKFFFLKFYNLNWVFSKSLLTNHLFFDLPEPSHAFFFQDPGNKCMCLLVDLHHRMMVYLVFIVFFVLWFLFLILIKFSTDVFLFKFKNLSIKLRIPKIKPNKPFYLFTDKSIINTWKNWYGVQPTSGPFTGLKQPFYVKYTHQLLNIHIIYIIFIQLLINFLKKIFNTYYIQKIENFFFYNYNSYLQKYQGIYMKYSYIEKQFDLFYEFLDEISLDFFKCNFIDTCDWSKNNKLPTPAGEPFFSNRYNEVIRNSKPLFIKLYNYFTRHNYHNPIKCTNHYRFLIKSTVWYAPAFYESKKIKHKTFLEVIWTITPALVLITISGPSIIMLHNIDHPAVIYGQGLDNATFSNTIKVVGHQWYWTYQYLVEDFQTKFDGLENHHIIYSRKSEDSLMVQPSFKFKNHFRLLDVWSYGVVQTNQPIRVLTTSADVIHSWAIPSLAVKIDSCPGRLNQIWLETTRSGKFYGQCSEICGFFHGFMPVVIKSYNYDWSKNIDTPLQVKNAFNIWLDSLIKNYPNLFLKNFASKDLYISKFY